jgi:chemotaxis protein MotB
VRVLASKGVSPSRLAVIGYGENRPMQTNDTPEGRNANRRVVVVILSTDTSPSRPEKQPAREEREEEHALEPSSAGPPAQELSIPTHG